MNGTTYAVPSDLSIEAEGFEASKQAEESLCAAVLRSGANFKQVSEVVNSGSFRNEIPALLWRAYSNLDEQGLKIDQFTVADELQRMGEMHKLSDGVWSGRVYLSKLRDEGDPRNAMSYAENVADYAAKRHLYSLFSQGAAQSVNGRRAKDIVHDVLESLSKVTVYSVQDEYTVPLSVALGEAFDWSTNAAAGNIPGVRTGFTDLDNMLTALMSGNVYIIAGRPGTGKTALLISVIRFLAEKGFKVAVFSLEMSKMQVAQRLIAQEAGLNLTKVIAGDLTQDEWGLYGDALGRLERSGVFINDLSSINISQIRGTARKIKARHGLDIVVVDYIQLATTDSKKRAERRELEVSEVSRGLKYLARELEVPVLAAAQLSREVERRGDKRPILSDLRESGSLEQDAYAVMFIYRKEDEPEPKQNITEIIVAKHRNGKTGSVELIWRPELARFVNAATRKFGEPYEQPTNLI